MFAVFVSHTLQYEGKSLYEGTLDSCHIYAQGWYDCLILYTSYTRIYEESFGSMTFLHSPLVSQSDLAIGIVEIP